jgi:alkanesulfonate monooxygenase SsuD/methylene tetrahydromethanopterin reductase-like flavin-dependent oxidoreductase (luciferase family)
MSGSGAVRVRFAVSAGARPPEPAHLRTLVTEAERLGFDTLWFSDLGTLPSTDPILSVAMAASWTERIKLGVTIVPFGYEPYVFARQLAQLDRLSGGRLRVMLVPGLDTPGERRAFGIEGADRGRLLDEVIPVLRTLWAGEPVPDPDGGVPLPPLGCTPAQDHLQIWLAGRGPRALARVGRLADGWRGGASSAGEAAATIARIQAEAAAVGRRIDPGHFGLTIAYARDDRDLRAQAHLGEEPAAIGRAGLRGLVGELVDAGMSKFSVRRITPVTDWPDELAWLADTLLDLQT